MGENKRPFSFTYIESTWHIRNVVSFTTFGRLDTHSTKNLDVVGFLLFSRYLELRHNANSLVFPFSFKYESIKIQGKEVNKITFLFRSICKCEVMPTLSQKQNVLSCKQ